VRARSLQGLKFLGIDLDPGRNAECIAGDGEVSSPASPVKVFAILTNEELVIAMDTERIASSLQQQRR
jgi:acetate kinase